MELHKRSFRASGADSEWLQGPPTISRAPCCNLDAPDFRQPALSTALTREATWQEVAAQAAPAQDQAAAVHRAADSGCREAAAPRALAVPQAAPRQAVQQARAVRWDPVAPEPGEDQEAVSAGLVRGLPSWRNVG
jgi:hypothetical protein